MSRVAKNSCFTLLLALPLIGVGCVPQDKYDQLLMANRSLEEQLMQTENERDAARTNLETVRDQLTRTTVNLNELQSQNSRLRAEVEEMGGDYDALLRRVSNLEIGPLPPDVESAIQSLAAAYPDVLSFDAQKGLLRFASDFTFDLGSAQLKSDAERTLQALAQILNTETARGFEARIVGHTDNVPIRRAETRRNHPSNVHLSVHRAISVRDALVNSGVAPVRIQVAGYGEHRPQVPNRTGGTPENRRVEVFLVAMPTDISVEESASPQSDAQPSAPDEPSRPPEPMK